ncbi:MAG: ABC transporter ATP-binding protein [Enterococcus sp.]|nr:ABC transporter ATP-binding protein [Enterococcus sp.]
MIFRAKNLSVRYPRKKEDALSNISLQINEGEIIGLVGHNGAGKTTLLKIICNLLLPSNYDEYYFNKRVQTSLITNSDQLYNNLTVLENIQFTFALYKKKFNEVVVEDYLIKTNLLNFKNEKIGNLSTGQKQKVNIVKALSVGSNFLILDEPTSGLDPIARYEFHQLISSVVQDEKITVIFCSHIISEVEKICSRIIMLNSGSIVRDKAINELFSEFPEYVIEIETKPRSSKIDDFLSNIHGENYIEKEVMGKSYFLIKDEYIDIDEIQKIRLDSFVKRKTSLEDIYMFINSGG